MRLVCLWVVSVLVSTSFAQAEFLPMTSRASLLGPAERVSEARPGSASLFSGTHTSGLFAPERAVLRLQSSGGFDPRRDLLDLIAKAEAGPLGYDAVQFGARIKPSLPPTQMTLRQIHDWIEATPGQPHAIGRYQFIPKTLRWLVERMDLPLNTRFTPDVQDRLAHLLLRDAGYDEFRAGTLARHAFMNNLAKTWAGLPNDTGRSHYDGFAGNKATMTWPYFDKQMARIFSG